jgi:hypothetical protein
MELRDYTSHTTRPWFFYGHLVKTPSGVRLHYTVQNRITGGTLCTYRQIKKARQTVCELNAVARRLMTVVRSPIKPSVIISKLRDITGAQ